ncbi:uncharacterized protein BKA55DRAFT_570891 [Fusarium redolens]|uniref:Uncharacterized protein n=1 Tax=Fusarium redolens TaxID=48865 RepID=A0A9P9H2P2_FUSRE|nr:uncharacterized protein BKA55DRAFT_570891 [Fusarium redolens]KAH7249084.1 hypothetical protein BKA55DRAFT_570891 [Fusarium redolens]
MQFALWSIADSAPCRVTSLPLGSCGSASNETQPPYSCRTQRPPPFANPTNPHSSCKA